MHIIYVRLRQQMVADVDDDGRNELVMASTDMNMYVYRVTPSFASAPAPQEVIAPPVSFATLADLAPTTAVPAAMPSLISSSTAAASHPAVSTTALPAQPPPAPVRSLDTSPFNSNGLPHRGHASAPVPTVPVPVARASVPFSAAHMAVAMSVQAARAHTNTNTGSIVRCTSVHRLLISFSQC